MPSLKAIAAETQLSQATVSRILRNRDECSADTRRRVLDAAMRLKYRPNLLVRGMQTGRTQTVGVMLPVWSEFFGWIFEGVHRALNQIDHVPMLLWGHDPLVESPQRNLKPQELTQIYRLIDRRVDGVILRPVHDSVTDSYLQQLWDRQIPVVALDRELEHTQADFAGNDDVAIGRAAAEFLLSLGHRRLAQIAGPESATSFARRSQGFEAAVREAGATCQTFPESRPAAVTGLEWQHVLGSHDRPTAIFAGNDEIALMVLSLATQRGLSVPRDLSVVGCGNLSVGAAVTPGLTTIDQRPQLVGQAAVELLMSRIENPAPGSGRIRKIVPFELVVRGSTAALS